MRFQKLVNGMIGFALIGAVFTALVPTAAAQSSPGQGQADLQIELSSQSPEQILMPLQTPVELTGKVTFIGDAASPRSSFTGIQVTFEKISGPAWATVVFNPPSLVLTPEASPGSEKATDDATFKVLVSASQDAPAFTESELKIQAKTSGSQFVPSVSRPATASIRAAYFSILDVAVPETIKVERPQTPVSFPVTITNFGNGPTKVNFELITQLDGADKMQIIPPQALTLEARQTGGSAVTKDAILQIQTPYKNGYLNEPRSVTIKLTSHYATNSQLPGASDQVTVLVTTKGFYVPGPSPIFLVGMVALAAVAARKLRS